MRRFIILTSLLLFFSLYSTGNAREISFTQDDRDRLIRLEEGQKALQKQIDDLKYYTEKQIEGLEKQIDDLRVFMLWGFGILFGGMGILIGFVIWDRRTALAPAIKRTTELEEKEEKIEKALKELASKNPDVAEALKNAGLL